MFIGGIRTSTVLIAAAFLLASLLPGLRRRALLGGLAWLFGFELAWQWTTFALRGSPPSHWVWPTYSLLLLSPLAIWLAHRYGVRVSRPLALLTMALWLVWLGQGFHVDVGGVSEVLNQAAKTAWGLAYLVPLLAQASARSRPRRALAVSATPPPRPRTASFESGRRRG